MFNLFVNRFCQIIKPVFSSYRTPSAYRISKVHFVEKNPAAVCCIRENLKFTRLDADAFVVQSDVFAALDRLRREIEDGKESFGVIFMDPPYNQELEKRVLSCLKDSKVADERTLIIIEASLETDFSYLKEFGFRVLKRKEYKTNVHMFIEKEKKEL